MGAFNGSGRMYGGVISCAGRAIAALLLIIIAMGMLAPVSAMAQGNPLDPPKKPALELPQFFEGDGLILSLEKLDAATGRAEGRIMLGDNVFPYVAMRAEDGSLRGEFTANENAYAFTAAIGANRGLTFRTGDAAYTLAPVERPSRALPGDPVRTNPLGNKPGPSNPGANGAAPQETLQEAVDAWGRNDMPAVIKTLRPLADRGHIGASYLVGILLADGAEGVQQDPKSAVGYIEHAANHEHPGALFMLGEMYFWGHGVEQSEQKGLDAITAAAKLGEPAAMANLGTFLYDGTRVTENETDGLAWLLIAEKRGDPFARETVAKMKQDRNITQADWDRANKRVPEIEAVIAAGPVPDYLLDFNRSEPLDRRADAGGGAEPPPASTNLTGRWTGTATEKFADGTTGRYPAQLDLRATSGNAYAGQFSFETTATMEGGQNVTIRGSAQLTGTLANNQLSMRTDDLTLRIVETNQSHPLGAQSMTLDLRDNRLTGRIGNDQIGWTELDLTNEALATTPNNTNTNTSNNTNTNNNATALAGTWSGTGRDEAEDGTPLTFPITINLAQGGDGTLTADLRSVVNYPVGQGQTVAVELRGRFTGRAGANGVIELHTREVIASANGQSESIGAQSLRLQPSGANRMTGQVGNDMEGWTPIELERQGGAPAQRDPRGGGLDGGGGAGGGGNPAVRGNTANMPGTVVFRKVELRDPGMDNLVSHTLLAPKDWQVQGGQQWNPQTYRDFVHLNLRISAPDGRELAVYPGGFYEDSNIYEVGAQMGAQNARPRPGQVLGNGITHMPVPQSVSQYVTNILMPMHRPQAQNMQVVATTPLDSLRKQLDEVLAPVRQNMAQGDEQLRQMGGQVQSSLTTIAERVRVRYQENGRTFEEDVWVLGTVNHSVQQTQGMPPVHMWYWRMMDPRGVRAPAGQLDDARPLLEAISLSIMPEPRYQAIIMHLQHKINMKELEALAKRGEIARQGREEAWQIYQSGVKEQQASTERMHDSFNEYIQDIDRFQDLDGSTVRLPSLYSYVYSNSNGEYILTNEPTFNPNDQPNRTEQWERINPKR